MFGAVGRWSCRHRRGVMAAWAVLFVIGIAVGGQVFGHLKDSNGGSRTESVRGFNVMDKASTTGPTAIALVDGRSVSDPATRAAVLAAAHKVERVRDVTGVVTAYDSNDPKLRATDGRASLMIVSVRKTDDMTVVHRQVGDIRAALKNAVPGAMVRVGGDLAISRDGTMAVAKDLYKGELIALPVLLLGLVLVFRGWRIALIPLAGGLVTIAGALLLLRAMTVSAEKATVRPAAAVVCPVASSTPTPAARSSRKRFAIRRL